MKLLAFDSSGLVASVAIVTEDALLAEYTVNYKKTHSQTLLPMINEIVQMVDVDLKEIDAIVVSSGPGSFTGLRIGSATAKGLGMALNIPIIPVPTLEAMAYNLYGSDKLICPMMDARRNQVYTGLYKLQDSELIALIDQEAVAVEDIIEEINNKNLDVIFLGDGATAYVEIIKEKTKVKWSIAPNHLNRQKAGSLGQLGIKYMQMNKKETAKQHEPIYLRLSQAERERNEKQNEA